LYPELRHHVTRISEKLPKNPDGPKTGYKFYTGPEIKGVPQSISLVDSGKWIATLSLNPEISFRFKEILQTSDQNTILLSQRIENALLHFVQMCTKMKKK
jgi:hypothetical protein